MNPWQSFTAGISPHHVPALVAAALLPLAVWLMRPLRAGGRPVPPPAGLVDRWSAWLLGTSAAIHLALPIGDHDSVLLTAGFLAAGIAYGWLALRAASGRPYRALAVALIVANLIVYVVVLGAGAEQADQVGIATALDELLALTLCSVPSRHTGRPRWGARLAGSTASTAFTIVVGAGIWFVTLIAPPATGTEQGHAHDFAARAQDGVVLGPVTADPPTPAQVKAAADLAARTKAATAMDADIHAALADGYKVSGRKTGYEVHLEKKANQLARSILDPDKPQALVYAILDGKATLLGVLYQMPDAGVPGPAVGGRITRWHTHNGCATLTPPGVGVVSPFGTCPPFSVQVTGPETMHVWVLDNPAGPFGSDLDKNWVRAYSDTHGLPYP